MEASAINCPKCGAPLNIEDAISNMCICIYCTSRVLLSIHDNGQISAKLDEKVTELVSEKTYLENIEKKIEILKKAGKKEELERVSIIRKQIQETIEDIELEIVFKRENPLLEKIDKLSVLILQINSLNTFLYKFHKLQYERDFPDEVRGMVNVWFLPPEIKRELLNKDPKSVFGGDLWVRKYLLGTKREEIDFYVNTVLNADEKRQLDLLSLRCLPFRLVKDISRPLAQKIKNAFEESGISFKIYPSNSRDYDNIPLYSPLECYKNALNKDEPIYLYNKIKMLSGFMNKKATLGIFNVYLDKFIFKSDTNEIVMPFSQIQKIQSSVHVNTVDIDLGSTKHHFDRTHFVINSDTGEENPYFDFGLFEGFLGLFKKFRFQQELR